MAKNKLSLDDIKFIQNLLREGSIKWSGRAECLQRARKKVFERRAKNGNAVYKFYWQCAKCLRWERNEKNMEVDHIKEIGSFCGDWNAYILRQYPSQENLQCLCIPCHMKKTNAYNSARTKWVRKK